MCSTIGFTTSSRDENPTLIWKTWYYEEKRRCHSRPVSGRSLKRLGQRKKSTTVHTILEDVEYVETPAAGIAPPKVVPQVPPAPQPHAEQRPPRPQCPEHGQWMTEREDKISAERNFFECDVPGCRQRHYPKPAPKQKAKSPITVLAKPPTAKKSSSQTSSASSGRPSGYPKSTPVLEKSSSLTEAPTTHEERGSRC